LRRYTVVWRRTVQVIQTRVDIAWRQRLKLKYDESAFSSFAFNFK